MGPLPMKVEWKFVPMGHMAQCVMTGGTNLMPESSVNNWDMTLMVRLSIKYIDVKMSPLLFRCGSSEEWRIWKG